MRFLTAGESHGPGLTVIIDNFPAGVPLDIDAINADLRRRQEGYGRGGRQKIETDTVRFNGGVRFKKTTGAPISLWIENRDFKNWTDIMSAEGEPTKEKAFTKPRPGHADLAGFYKYGHTDLRDVLERSSARETAARVAAGAIAKQLLRACGIEVFSHVTVLGGISIPETDIPEDLSSIPALAEANDLRCAGSKETQDKIRTHIDEALQAGTTLGGEVEVIALNCPPGLGSYVQWDRKLDGQLAQAVMSIQAVKSVTLGAGERGAIDPGHEFHDAITKQDNDSITRPTNRAGGLEGGVTNGMPVVVRAVMKPISTMRTALPSVDLKTGEEEAAHFERSDVTAVPACAVIAEAMVAISLASALLDKFGRDSLNEVQCNLSCYTSDLSPKPV